MINKYRVTVQDNEEKLYLDIAGIHSWEIPYNVRNATGCSSTDLVALCYSNIIEMDLLILEIPCIADNKTYFIHIEKECS